MTNIIDGRKIARQVRERVSREIKKLKITPTLAVLSVGENDASKVYIRQKKKIARKIGINLKECHYPNSSTSELREKIIKLNNDKQVNGILVQLPLPREIDEKKIMETVSPEKDVDGFHPVNFGKLVLGEEGFAPCTPLGIMRMLEYHEISLEGKDVVIVNHSEIVGKPLALMLLNKNATTHVCHVYTKNPQYYTLNADILVTAAGVPNLIRSEMVKEGVIIIDVSINRVQGKLCGDTDFDRVKEKASLITPVPGGVGPMTVAMLMENTLKAAKSQIGI